MAQSIGPNTEDFMSWIRAEENRIDMLNYLSPDKPGLSDIFIKRLAMIAVFGLIVSLIGMISENPFKARYLSEQQIRQELSQGIN